MTDSNSDLLELLASLSTSVRTWMETPQFWDNFPFTGVVIPDDWEIKLYHDGLGDRFKSSFQAEIEAVAGCYIRQGIGSSAEVKSLFERCVSFLNLASESMNQRAAKNKSCNMPVEIIPEQVAFDYRCEVDFLDAGENPVAEFCRILDVAGKYKETKSVTAKNLPDSSTTRGMTADEAAEIMRQKIRDFPDRLDWSEKKWMAELECTKHAISGKNRKGEYVNSSWKEILQRRHDGKVERQQRMAEAAERYRP